MSDQSTSSVPALPTFVPNPGGIPVATFSMQKVLTKAIRSHASNQTLHTKVKGAEKMGGKRSGRAVRSTGAGSRSGSRK